MSKFDIIWNLRLNQHIGVTYDMVKQPYEVLYEFYQRSYQRLKLKTKEIDNGLENRRKALTRNGTFRKTETSMSRLKQNISIRSSRRILSFIFILDITQNQCTATITDMKLQFKPQVSLPKLPMSKKSLHLSLRE